MRGIVDNKSPIPSKTGLNTTRRILYPSVVLSTSSRNDGTKVRLEISKIAKTLAIMYNGIRLV